MKQKSLHYLQTRSCTTDVLHSSLAFVSTVRICNAQNEQYGSSEINVLKPEVILVVFRQQSASFLSEQNTELLRNVLLKYIVAFCNLSPFNYFVKSAKPTVSLD